MNNEFEQLDAEQNKISELYQRLKVEQPSSQVDHKILTLAKSQASKASQSVPIPLKQKRSWRQWQWPTSVAASVLLVSVVFIGQYEFFTESQQVYSDAVPFETTELRAPHSLDSKTDTATTQEFNEQRAESAHQAVSEQQAMSAQRSAQFDDSHSEQLKAKKAQMEMQDMVKPQVMSQMAPASTKALNQLVTTQIEQLQTLLVAKFALLAKINAKQSRLFDDKTLAQLSETNVSITNAENLEIEQQISELQTQLLKQMRKKLAMQTDWQAPQALVDLLTEQQQAQWHKQINQESE